MSDNATTPQTTRQFIEEAMRRLVDSRTDLSGSTWQHIVRFFRGNVEKARIFYSCDAPKTELADEDGTPTLVSAELTTRISSHMDDAENTRHDQAAADILAIISDSTAVVASLNEAMVEDYGDIFRIRYAVPNADAETSVQGKRQITETKVTLWLAPVETALVWAAQNPQ